MFQMSKSNRAIAIGLTIGAVIGIVLFNTAQTTTPAVSTVHYLSPTGSDTASGSANAPWATLPHAISSMQPSDTLILEAGIYQLDKTQTYFLGPSGIDVNHKTIYIAAAGARVIITNADSSPPNIHLDSYLHVEGLWFGGTWDTHTGISSTGAGAGINPNFVLGGPLNDVVNNTFFGYGNICCGGDYLYFAGNRSVLTGAGDLSHALYLSGHDGNTTFEDNHAIIDNNIFVGEATSGYLNGLGIQAWHLHHNNIITRNFVADHIAGAATQYDPSLGLNDRSDLIANNFWWENGLTPESYPHGDWLAKGVWYLNNLGGPRGGIASGDTQTTAVGNTVLTNAFTQGSINHLLPFAPNTSTPGSLVYTTAGTAAAEGTTPQAIDAAIATLQNSFSIGVNGVTIQSLLADQTVEPAFNALHFHTPVGSPTFNTGTNWQGQGAVNIGPDVAAPTSPAGFWAAFRALGMVEFGDCDQRISPPYPNYPYGDVNNPNSVYNPVCSRATPSPTVSKTVSPTLTLTSSPSSTSTTPPTATPTSSLTSTPTLTSTPIQQPNLLQGIWNPVFDDEFSGSQVDQSKWSFCYPWDCHSGGNGELSVYTPQQVSVGGGLLDLQAVHQQTCDGSFCGAYGSGLIQSGIPRGGTTPRFTFTYGYVEARLQVPFGTGYFPAFWLLGPVGEIDLMEVFGNTPSFSCGVHFGQYTGKWGCNAHGGNMPGSWHTFAVDWQPDHITFFEDGLVVGSTTDPSQIPSDPMAVYFDFAIGANWLPPPDSTTVFPADYKVDYIRIWQPINPTATPSPTLTNTPSPTNSPVPTSTPTLIPATTLTPTLVPSGTPFFTSTSTSSPTQSIDCQVPCTFGVFLNGTPLTISIK